MGHHTVMPVRHSHRSPSKFHVPPGHDSLKLRCALMFRWKVPAFRVVEDQHFS